MSQPIPTDWHGVDEMLAEVGDDARLWVIEPPLPSKMPQLPNGRRPLTLKRLLEGDPPPPPQLQTEKFTMAADVTVFAGHGDAGKSTTLFAAAVSTVLGRPLFGTLAIKLPGPVVFVVPEDGEAVARHHVEAVIAGLEITHEERTRLVRDLHIIGDDCSFNLLTDTAELGALVASYQPVLVIADPISGLLGGEDENVERVAHMACDNMRRDVGRPTGAAVVLAGHLRKPERGPGATGTASIHDLKGSSGWGNHARMVWIVSKPKGGDVITFRLEKANRLQTGLEHQVKLAIEAEQENPAHWLSCRLTDANLGAASRSLTPGIGRAINDNERKALSALDDRHEPGARFSNSKWHGDSGITSPETFRGVKDRLLDAGLATAEPTGRMNPNGKSPIYQYGITDRGRDVLRTGWVTEGVKG